MTPWTPVPPEANHPSRRPRVPAIVNRACREAVTAPAPRSAGTPGKQTPSPRPGTRQPCLPGGRDGSRAPFRRALTKNNRRPRVPAIVNRAYRGAVTAPAPRSAGTPGKQTPSPRPGARQPSLRGRNPPFRGRLTHGHACFLIIQPLFMDKIPQPCAFVPSAAFFLKMSKKPLLPCRGFLLPVSLLKFCFSFVFGSVNAQTLCLFVHQAQNYIRTYTVEPA